MNVMKKLFRRVSLSLVCLIRGLSAFAEKAIDSPFRVLQFGFLCPMSDFSLNYP